MACHGALQELFDPGRVPDLSPLARERRKVICGADVAAFGLLVVDEKSVPLATTRYDCTFQLLID
jgi:hypothetical protein